MQVLVLGAGIIGVSTAEALATRGATVTVLDMRGPGQGASQAAAGMLTPFIEADGNTHLLDLCTRSLALYDQFVARLVESSRVPIEYARTGTLEVALDDDDAGRLLGTKVWLDTTGIDSEWLDGDAVRVFEPSVTPAALGGLYTPDHGLVAVPALMSTLVHQAKQSGAVFEFPVQAATLDQRHNRVDIVAGDRRYEADAVVVAAGSWSRRIRIVGGGALPVRPVRGQLLHLQWCEGDQPGRIVWGPHCYAVPWSNGGLLVGATVEDVGFDEGTTVSGVQALSTAAIELLPHASNRAPEA